MSEFYVYIYFDPTRELEAFYVGKGKGNRSHAHLKRVDKHPFTQRLQKMARRGVIPYIERYEDLTEEAAFALEVALISEIGRKNLGTGTLLNLTDGGEGFSGYVITDEHRLNISKGVRAAHTDEYKAKISAAHKGRKHTDKAKANMKAGAKGRTVSEEGRESMAKAMKGKKLSTKHKEQIAAGLKGRKLSEETRAKISASTTGKQKNKKGVSNV